MGENKTTPAEVSDTSAVTTQQVVQTEVLPSGKIAVVGEFFGKHIREATRIADGDSGKMIFALIAITTTIDGKPIVVEDLDLMQGRDVLKLQSMFSVNF
jgi:hypothetical protein